MLLSLGLLLLTARVLGELAKRFNQPAVLGELLSGILLGPTLLGHLAPELQGHLFPRSGEEAQVFKGITGLAVVLFLLVVGMEVNLDAIKRQGRLALAVSACGLAFPFALGFAAAWFAPQLLGMSDGAGQLIFALFFATAMSISALPVIAKTLMDINLFRSDLGMVVISAAIFNDLLGWIVFAIILGLMGGGAAVAPRSAGEVVLLTLCFTVAMMTAGRWLLHRILPWIHAHLSWPGGVLSFTLALALFGAALTEWIGLHAVFGAFLVGVAIGDSHHLRERTRAVLEQFISFFFAPLFFASIGLTVDFYLNFDLALVAVVLAIACAGKVLGCTLGARLGGMPRREAWAVGFGMNSRGAMEILLGMLALQAKVINERTFVALVVMALATSMMAGPVMQRLLRRKRTRRFVDHLTARTFALELKAASSEDAIRELAGLVAQQAGLEPGATAAAVLERERSMSTAIGNHLAVPHARLPGLAAPVVGVGLSRAGIPFAAPDGEDIHIVVLLLTSVADDGAQLELLADVAATFKSIAARDQAEAVRSYTEFLALVKTLHGIETASYPRPATASHAAAARPATLSLPAPPRAGNGAGSG
jgi:Kef-type K+ transport system membrane component KefB/mannitol/fructose-specific phosphotransferase system IIA component